jgi:hypothetical protein
MSPSCSIAMSHPCTVRISGAREIAMGREKVWPVSVERLKKTLFMPKPVKRDQQT